MDLRTPGIEASPERLAKAFARVRTLVLVTGTNGKSTTGASLLNAAVATMAGVWTHDEGGMPVTYQFGPTVLGGFASLAGVTWQKE